MVFGIIHTKGAWHDFDEMDDLRRRRVLGDDCRNCVYRAGSPHERRGDQRLRRAWTSEEASSLIWFGFRRASLSWEVSPNEPGFARSEGPRHPVRITRGFECGATEVTRAQYARFVK
jgi:formylglycine-generating enzyme required for sulfatase activity